MTGRMTFWAALSTAALLTSPALATEKLRILTWEGLADEAWISEFEQEFDVDVMPTFVGSNDEYMAALAAGGNQYDTAVIVSSLAGPAIKAGFVEPLDMSRIPNFDNIYPEFATSAILRDGETQYGVPTFWDIQPVTYNADKITDCSFDVLFDTANKGRIAMWDDVSTLGDVALYMGIDTPWTMDDAQLEQVRAKLIDQKPLIRRYWSTGGEIIELMTSGEVVATNSWSYVTAALREEGMNADQCAPERPSAWLDSHFIVKGSAQPELAHAFINFMLRPDVLAQIYEGSGFGVTVSTAVDHIEGGVESDSIMAQDAEFRSSISFWEEIPRRSRYLEVWNEVKAARN